jgi:hypothetical protein
VTRLTELTLWYKPEEFGESMESMVVLSALTALRGLEISSVRDVQALPAPLCHAWKGITNLTLDQCNAHVSDSVTRGRAADIHTWLAAMAGLQSLQTGLQSLQIRVCLSIAGAVVDQAVPIPAVTSLTLQWAEAMQEVELREPRQFCADRFALLHAYIAAPTGLQRLELGQVWAATQDIGLLWSGILQCSKLTHLSVACASDKDDSAAFAEAWQGHVVSSLPRLASLQSLCLLGPQRLSQCSRGGVLHALQALRCLSQLSVLVVLDSLSDASAVVSALLRNMSQLQSLLPLVCKEAADVYEAVAAGHTSSFVLTRAEALAGDADVAAAANEVGVEMCCTFS